MSQERITLRLRERDLRSTDIEQLAAVLAGQPDDDDVERLAAAFALLGEPSRLRLLIGLLTADELCVTDLAVISGLSESATSHALRLLRAHGVVRARRAGRRVHYRLDDDHVRGALATALEHVSHDHG